MSKKKHPAKQCLSSACQLAQAIKQYKTILDPVGSATTYYLQGRKVDLQARPFFASFFVENQRGKP